jgi:hypothetical protein
MATKKRFFIIAFLFLIPMLAKADSVWTYQGNVLSNSPFGVGEGFALIGTVLLNNNDQAIAWNFTGGPDNFTNFNSTGTIDPFAANSFTNTGSIDPFACTSCKNQQPFVSWYIFLFNPCCGAQNGGINMTSYSAFGGWDNASNHDGSAGQVNVIGNPGIWTEVVSTPEPGSLLLLGAGITALALTITLQKFRA